MWLAGTGSRFLERLLVGIKIVSVVAQRKMFNFRYKSSKRF